MRKEYSSGRKKLRNILWLITAIIFVGAWILVVIFFLVPAIVNGDSLSFVAIDGSRLSIVGDSRLQAQSCSYFVLLGEGGEKLVSDMASITKDISQMCPYGWYYRLDQINVTGNWEVVEGYRMDLVLTGNDITVTTLLFHRLAITVVILVAMICVALWGMFAYLIHESLAPK